MYYDPSYYAADAFRTDELTVETQNNLIAKLRRELPSYGLSVPDVNVKSSLILNAWSHSTYRWKLDCEITYGITR
jgi:hypothetical protein